MFGQKLLIKVWHFHCKALNNYVKCNIFKTKRLCNPKGIRWVETKNKAKISEDGLKATSTADRYSRQYVLSEKGFAISGEDCRKDNFPGTIIYYFEVTIASLSG
jgi:hypothetical protein